MAGLMLIQVFMTDALLYLLSILELVDTQDSARYQDNPMADVAAKCFVSEDQYSSWLTHYQQPSCEAVLPNGDRCSMPIDRVDTPSRYVPGDSNCCARHKASKRAR